jgi:hypothetical protein
LTAPRAPAAPLPQPVKVAAVVYKFGAAVLFGVSPDHSVVADPLLALIRQHRGKAPSHWKAAGAEAGEVFMEGGAPRRAALHCGHAAAAGARVAPMLRATLAPPRLGPARR